MTIIRIKEKQLINHSFTGDDICSKNIPAPDTDCLTWIHLIGITDNEQLHQLLQPFNIHELAMEDMLSRKQRPKIEDYGHYLSLLDRIIDDYFVTVDEFDNRVEGVDKRLFSNSNKNLLILIHQLKRDASNLRRTLSPIRDIVGRIVHGEFSMFSQNTHVYLLDVYDHTQQLMETLDSARDTVMGMMDVHLSYQSNHLNEQMRMLTVITIIVMPLNVLTGIYGMNFDNMPELHWHYSYFVVLGLMATIIISLLIYFYRRRWL